MVQRDSQVVTVMSLGMEEAFLRFADAVLQYSHVNTSRIVGLAKKACLPNGKTVADRRRAWRELHVDLYERLKQNDDCLTPDEEDALVEELKEMKLAYKKGLDLIPGTEDRVLGMDIILRKN